jgi:hypothetical protein
MVIKIVLHGGSRGSSKVLLGSAIPYHCMPCIQPTPARPDVGHLQDECTIMVQGAPGPPMKNGPCLDFGEVGAEDVA